MNFKLPGKLSLAVSCGFLLSSALLSHAQASAFSTCGAGRIQLADRSHAMTIYVPKSESETVRLSAKAFADDLAAVTGSRPAVVDSLAGVSEAIVVGTASTPEMRKWLNKKQIAASEVEGKREAAVTFAASGDGLKRAFVVAGSDRRGAAYALFDLSRAMGVSPWKWWADVPVAAKQAVCVDGSLYRQAEPSVEYRGIFLNDEDFGLRPWAAKKMDPEVGNIGPRTYERIYELLLRLGANTLWPAMHPRTVAFNQIPENAKLADKWGIVMGASHSEALLRDNAVEWDEKRDGPWNYQTNHEAIDRYWLERLKTNGHYENFYTVGMRGVHDTGLEAEGTAEVKARLVETVMAKQRQMLASEVSPEVVKIPQVIWLYKESLELYRAGMQVPQDVTLGWTDDNFGYIRQLSTKKEQERAGGGAVYYHVSYWGFPHDHLWLCSTPPALIGEEMGKAYEHGARRLWILNVGDIKPAELDMEYFLTLGRSVKETAKLSQREYLRQWLGEQFGAEKAAEAAEILGAYYKLNFVRRPEFMGFNGYDDDVKRGKFNPLAWGDENKRRQEAWLELAERAKRFGASLDEAHQAAFFELIGYPVEATAAMNEKVLSVDRSYLDAANQDEAARARDAAEAEAAYARIVKLTAEYNELLGGKWQGMMDLAPRQRHVFDAPKPAAKGEKVELPADWKAGEASAAGNCSERFCESGRVVSINAAHASAVEALGATQWKVIEDLGISGSSMELPITESKSEQMAGGAVEYEFGTVTNGAAKMEVFWLPSFAVDSEHRLRYRVTVDGGAPVLMDLAGKSEWKENSAPSWEKNVLRGAAIDDLALGEMKAGHHKIRIEPIDPGMVLEHLLVSFPGAAPTYPVPPESVKE